MEYEEEELEEDTISLMEAAFIRGYRDERDRAFMGE